MKKQSIILVLVAVIGLAAHSFGQNYSNIPTDSIHGYITPGGLMDTVFDNFGNKYGLRDIKIDSVKTRNGMMTKSKKLCTGGYFNLYFEDGSGMEDTSMQETVRRNVICQVFTDISAFIISPLSNPINPYKVNIWIRDINQIVTNPIFYGVSGVSTPFYNVPFNYVNSNGGIADNEVWKTIHAGIDSYIGVLPPIISQGGQNTTDGITFYHGMMAFNFNEYYPGISYYNWNTDLSLPNAPSNYFDLYTVILHEALHTLGFVSLINSDGSSKFGQYNPYYSRYDLFLKNDSLTQYLITNVGNCILYNYHFNTALNQSILHPGCTSIYPQDTSNCPTAIKYVGSDTVPVFTPACFEGPSSFSHFEDMCYPSGSPYGNNRYFVMSNYQLTDSLGTKRYLKPEERKVLCDIGYNVVDTFGNVYNHNNYNYNSIICPGIDVAGINDIFSGSTNVTLSISGILYNDSNATSFDCLEDIFYPASSISTTYGVDTTTISFSSSVGGNHVLRYIPISSTGKRGNITYIFIFLEDKLCMPNCTNLIRNGSFETLDSNYDDHNPFILNQVCGWYAERFTPQINFDSITGNHTALVRADPGSFEDSYLLNGGNLIHESIGQFINLYPDSFQLSFDYKLGFIDTLNNKLRRFNIYLLDSNNNKFYIDSLIDLDTTSTFVHYTKLFHLGNVYQRIIFEPLQAFNRARMFLELDNILLNKSILINNIGILGYNFACDTTVIYKISNYTPLLTYTWHIDPNWGSITSNNDSSIFVYWSPISLITDAYTWVRVCGYDSIGCNRCDSIKVYNCCYKDFENLNHPWLSNDTINIEDTLSGSMFINNTLVINANTLMYNANNNMGPMAKIVVKSPNELKINNSFLFSACNYMWDGIYIEPGAKLSITYSRIQDAINAVVSTNCGQYHINNTTFDKNYIDMKISDCDTNLHSSLIRTIFDCTANLISPHSGEKTIKGLDISNVNDISIGEQGFPTGISGQVGDKNYFQNLHSGIYNLNSNLKVYNTNFYNMLTNASPSNNYTYFGTGIFSANNTTNATLLNIGEVTITGAYSHNSFVNCPTAVWADKMQEVNIMNDTFNNCINAAIIFKCLNLPINITFNYVYDTDTAFRIVEFKGSTVDIYHNYFRDVQNCILTRNAYPSTVNYFRIQNNVMNYRNFSAVGSMNYGIDVWNVKGNLYDQSKCLQIYRNNITYDFTPPLTSANKFVGIREYSCNASYVKENRIEYDSTLSLDSTKSKYSIGMKFIQSPRSTVCGNFIYHTGQGMFFEGYTGSNINHNELYKCFYAIEYNNAHIGNQGSDNPKTVNKNYFWDYRNPTYVTWMHGTVDSTKWYYYSAGIYNEKIEASHLPISPISGVAIYSPDQIPDCRIDNGIPPYPNPTLTLEEIANQEVQYKNDEEMFRYYEARYFCGSILLQPDLLDSLKETANDFYAELENENVFLEENFYLKLIEEKYDYAKDELDKIDLNDSTLEVYYTLASVAPIFLNSWALEEEVISSSDTSILQDIGKGNLFLDGNAVAAACVMLNWDLPVPIEEQSLLPKINKRQASFHEIYPNPVNEIATLEYFLPYDNAVIKITDILGRVIASYSINSNETFFRFSVKDLNEGVYFANIEQNGTNLFSCKFVVIK